MTLIPRLLLIDDNNIYAESILSHMPDFHLLEVQPNLHRAPHGTAALNYLGKHSDNVDAILLDMRFDVDVEHLLPLEEATSDRKLRRFQGIAILRQLKLKYPAIPVIVLTSMADLSLGEVANELDALSLTYVLDEQNLDSLRIRIHSALSESYRQPEDGEVLWGRSLSLRHLRRRLAVLATGRLPVILEGETGTGKSFLAEHYVHLRSGRSGPFVTVDLSTIPSELVAAHLFGAMRGAYTGAVADRKGVFELAQRGTLFIDEIQNTPLEIQKQLLGVLQDNRVRPLGAREEVPIDVKVIVASNASLSSAVRDGRFRADLFMRLSPATRITIPPLRQRMNDFEFLLQRFTDRSSQSADVKALHQRLTAAIGAERPIRLVLPDDPTAKTDSNAHWDLALPRPALHRLRRHRWPGNLRELSMVVHNIVIFTLVGAVDALEAGVTLSSHRLQIDPGLVGQLVGALDDVNETEQDHPSPGQISVTLEPADSLNAVSVSVERQYFSALFHQTGGDLELMADRLLGDPSRARAIRLRLNQLGLRIRQLRKE